MSAVLCDPSLYLLEIAASVNCLEVGERAVRHVAPADHLRSNIDVTHQNLAEVIDAVI